MNRSKQIVCIYPNLEMAKYYYNLEKEDSQKSARLPLKYLKNGKIHWYTSEQRASMYLRGRIYDEVYIHPNCKNRKVIFEELGPCKIIYKLKDGE